nr:upf0658 golgi apparatus membrane protein [Quercus suber]
MLRYGTVWLTRKGPQAGGNPSLGHDRSSALSSSVAAAITRPHRLPPSTSLYRVDSGPETRSNVRHPSDLLTRGSHHRPNRHQHAEAIYRFLRVLRWSVATGRLAQLSFGTPSIRERPLFQRPPYRQNCVQSTVRPQFAETAYAPGGYHDRQGLSTGTTGSQTTGKMYLPQSRWTWAFFLVALGQCIVSLALEAYVFGEFQASLHVPDDLSKDDTLSATRSIPTYLALYIFGFLYELILVWDALRLKNTIQVIGICLYNLGLLIYAAVEKQQVQDAVHSLTDPGIPTPYQYIDPDTWSKLEPFLVAGPCVLALGTVLLSLVAWKLYDEFAWSIYKHISADLRLKRRYLTYQIYIALLKFDFFFFLGFTVQFLVIVNNTARYEQGLTWAAIPITIALLLLAAYFTRRESYVGQAGIILVYFAAMAYFVFKLVRMYDSSRKQDYAPARQPLTTFAVLTITLLLVTIVEAFMCMRNFHQGLRPHIQRRKISDTDDAKYGMHSNGQSYGGPSHALGEVPSRMASPLSPKRMTLCAGTPHSRIMLSSDQILEETARDGTVDMYEALNQIVHNAFPIPAIPILPANADPDIIASTPPTSQGQDHERAPRDVHADDEIPGNDDDDDDANDDENQPPLNSQSSMKENEAPTYNATTPRTPSRPPVPTFTDTSHRPVLPSSASTEAEPGAIPPDLLSLYQTTTHVLERDFAHSPPYTIQRLAEMVLQPRKHYRFLPAYLRALDRIVSVSSPVSDFPLPTLNATINGSGFLTNGDNSLANGTSEREGLGSDESLGGALLTPIPWLRNNGSAFAGNGASANQHEGELHSKSTEMIEGPNGAGSIETVTVMVNGVPSATSVAHTSPLSTPASPTLSEQSDASTTSSTESTDAQLRQQGGVTQGELLRQEQEAGVVPATQPTYRRSLATHGAAAGREPHTISSSTVEPEDDLPHARGPEEVGMEDMGPQAQTSTGELNMEAAVGRAKSPPINSTETSAPRSEPFETDSDDDAGAPGRDPKDVEMEVEKLKEAVDAQQQLEAEQDADGDVAAHRARARAQARVSQRAFQSRGGGTGVARRFPMGRHFAIGLDTEWDGCGCGTTCTAMHDFVKHFARWYSVDCPKQCCAVTVKSITSLIAERHFTIAKGPLFISSNLLLRRRGIARLGLVGIQLLLREGRLRERRAAMRDGFAAAGDVAPDGAQRARTGATALPERVEADAEAAAEEPEDADGDPAGEEGLAEDVAGAVHGHRPDDEQGDGQEDGRGGAGNELEVDMCGGGKVGVVAEADGFHRLPVVSWGPEDETENGNEDQRGQEGDDIAGEHRVAGSLNQYLRTI